jgi:carbamoyl-phosphate synthase large subunit
VPWVGSADSELTVLVSGVGAPALGPGTLRNLRASRRLSVRTIGIDASPAAVGRHFADRFEVVPWANDPSYVETVERLVRGAGVDVIVPLTDAELPPLLDIGERTGTPVAAPALEAASVALDKGVLLETLRRRSPKALFARVARTRDELVDAASAAGYPDADVVVKPCRGTGARGVWVLSAAADPARLLFERSALQTITIDWYLDKLPEAFAPLVVSPRVRGTEYTVACLTLGAGSATLPVRRAGFQPGMTTAGSFEPRADVIDECESLVAYLGLQPYCNVQLVHDGEAPRIFEINPRLSTSSVACARAGVNIPEALVLNAVGLEVELGEIEWGLTFERFSAELYGNGDAESACG